MYSETLNIEFAHGYTSVIMPWLHESPQTQNQQACVRRTSETGPKGAHSGSCGGEPLVSQSWEV